MANCGALDEFVERKEEPALKLTWKPQRTSIAQILKNNDLVSFFKKGSPARAAIIFKNEVVVEIWNGRETPLNQVLGESKWPKWTNSLYWSVQAASFINAVVAIIPSLIASLRKSKIYARIAEFVNRVISGILSLLNKSNVCARVARFVKQVASGIPWLIGVLLNFLADRFYQGEIDNYKIITVETQVSLPFDIRGFKLRNDEIIGGDGQIWLTSNISKESIQSILNYFPKGKNDVYLVDMIDNKFVEFISNVFISLMGRKSYAEIRGDTSLLDDLGNLAQKQLGEQLSQLGLQIKKISVDFKLQQDIFRLIDDKEEFPGLRKIVLEHVPKICKDKDYKSKAKNDTAFIEEYSLNVAKETVITFIDTSTFFSRTVGILITTHAIYVANRDTKGNILKLAYSEIDSEKIGSINDIKGTSPSLSIAIKGKDPITVKNSINHEAFLKMVTEVCELSEFASSDAPQPLLEMGYSVKLPFVKYVVNFLIHCEQPWVEAMRFACDIGMTDDEQLRELRDYIDNPIESNDSMLMKINNDAPHGSRRDLRYALITEMYRQLYITKAYACDDESALEREFIRTTAENYKLDSADTANLKIAVKNKYKFIAEQIKPTEEVKGVLARLRSITISKKDAELSKQNQETITSEIKSYISTIERLQLLFPEMTDGIGLLKKRQHDLERLKHKHYH